jgi:Ca2+-binding EF-hand superfamily protein
MYNTVSGNAVAITGKQIHRLFIRFDTNKDGMISLQEYKECVRADPELIRWFDFLNKGVKNPLNLNQGGLNEVSNKSRELTTSEALQSRIHSMI